MHKAANEQKRREITRTLIYGHVLGQQVKNKFEIEKLVCRILEATPCC